MLAKIGVDAAPTENIQLKRMDNRHDASINEKAFVKSGSSMCCAVSPNNHIEHDHTNLIASSTLHSLAVRSLDYSNNVHTSTPTAPSANEYPNGVYKAYKKQLQNFVHILRGFNFSRNKTDSNKFKTEAEKLTRIKLVDDQLNTSHDKLDFLFSSVNGNLLPFGLLSLVVGIIYEMVIVTVPYDKTESLFDIATLLQKKVNEVIGWAQDQHLYDKLSPLLCGTAVAIFSFMMVYLDSDIPGVSPPSPFSPLKYTYRRERQSALHLGYIIALASGAIVTILMYCDLSSFEM